MENITDLLERIRKLRLKIRNEDAKQSFKHMRGRHDQRSHNRWPAGYIAQSGANNGAVENRRANYLKRLSNSTVASSANTDSINTNLIATPSSSLILYSANPIPSTPLKKEIEKVQKEREKVRLPKKFDISKQQMEDLTDVYNEGSSHVMKFEGPDGRIYFYRQTPSFVGPDEPGAWTHYPSYLLTLAADDLSGALGLNIAPVAEMMAQSGRIVTNGMEFTGQNGADVLEEISYIQDEDTYLNYERSIEAIAVLDLILGQNDANGQNYMPAHDDFSPSGIAARIACFDYDLSGSYLQSTVWEYFSQLRTDSYLARYRPPNETGLLSNDMRSRLEAAVEMVKWNSDLPVPLQRQLIARINALLDADMDFASSWNTDVSSVLDEAAKSDSLSADEYSAREDFVDAEQENSKKMSSALTALKTLKMSARQSMDKKALNETFSAWLESVTGKKTFEELEVHYRNLKNEHSALAQQLLSATHESQINALKSKMEQIKSQFSNANMETIRTVLLFIQKASKQGKSKLTKNPDAMNDIKKAQSMMSLLESTTSPSQLESDNVYIGSKENLLRGIIEESMNTNKFQALVDFLMANKSAALDKEFLDKLLAIL